MSKTTKPAPDMTARDEPQAQPTLAWVRQMMQQGRLPQAREALEDLCRREPGSLAAHLHLGKVAMLMGDYPRALKALEHAACLPGGADDPALSPMLDLCRRHAIERPPSPPAPQAPAPPAPGPKSMVVVCAPGLDNFLDDVVKGLAPQVAVEKAVSAQAEDLLAAIARHSVVWLEWGNEMAAWLTKQAAPALKGKRVILRIHSYEVLDRLADQIDYRLIDDLIFVSPFIRDILLGRRPEVARQVKRLHVIPNGIDLSRYRFAERRSGFNLAYIGSLNFKKDPMVLMHAFQALHKAEPRLRLHIAGQFQQDRYELAFRHFLANNRLAEAVVHHGWVKDINQWLADKHFVILTSLMESQNLGVQEAMATGLKPLVYNFPGAPCIYAADHLWGNLDELVALYHGPYRSEDYRRFIAENYSLELELGRLRAMLGQETVTTGERMFTWTPN